MDKKYVTDKPVRKNSPEPEENIYEKIRVYKRPSNVTEVID
jgi:hypothetical protein